jgi:hypothetical protein
MSFVKLQDGRSIYSLDSLRLRNQRQATLAPQQGAVELYFKNGTLFQLDESGVEQQVSVVNLSVLPLTGITTAERNALQATAGMIIFNTSVSKHQGYNGSTWQDLY